MGFFDDSAIEFDTYETPKELSAIFSNPDLDSETLDLAHSVDSGLRNLQNSGVDPADAKPRESLFGKVLHVLSFPGEIVKGPIDAALRGDIFGKDAKTGEDVGLGIMRAYNEHLTTQDILRRNHVLDEHPVIRAGVGLAGDILSDPLMWVGPMGGVRMGGRLMTEEGAATINNITKPLFEAVATSPEAKVSLAGSVDAAVAALGRYQKNAELLKTATPAITGDIAASMTRDLSLFAPVLGEDVAAATNLFKKPGVHIGMNIPFLGNLAKTEAPLTREVLLESSGPVADALKDAGVWSTTKDLLSSVARGAGKVWSPYEVSIGDINFSPEILSAVGRISAFTNNTLYKISTGVRSAVSAVEDATSGIPLVGGAVKSLDEIGTAGKNLITSGYGLFKRIFNSAAVVGADNKKEIDIFRNAKAGNSVIAKRLTLEGLGGHDVANLKEATLVLDALGAEALTPILDKYAGMASAGVAEAQIPLDLMRQANEELQAIKKARKIGEAGVPALERLLDPSTQIGQELTQATTDYIKTVTAANAPFDPKTKAALLAVHDTLLKAVKFETENGVKISPLAYYYAHKFEQMERGAVFTKERTFATLSDAFKERGYVPDFDVTAVVEGRIRSGLNMVSQKNFLSRLATQNSFDPNTLKAAYRAAVENPTGPEAAYLNKRGFDIKIMPEDLRLQGEAASKYQQKTIDWIKAPEGEKDAIAAQLYGPAAEVQRNVHNNLMAAGMKPLNADAPLFGFNELGKTVTVNGTDYHLPNALANAVTELTASKDILREAAQSIGGRFGTSFIDMMDAVSNSARRLLTGLWPQYWAQNFLGDRFNQAMLGVEAMNPGIGARLASVMAGKSAIVTPSGLTIDKAFLNTLFEKNGFKFGLNELFDITEATGKLNMDRMMAAKNNSLWKNLTGDQKLAAWDQARGARDLIFNDYQRAMHAFHRLESGDTPFDAIKAAQDAYFNYRDMHPVEQSVFRRFFMFYGYLSKATKRSVTDLFRNPGNINLQTYAATALGEAFSKPGYIPPTVDEFDMSLLNSTVGMEQLSRVIGKDSNGKPIIARGFAAPINSLLQAVSMDMPRNYSIGELIDTTVDSARRTIQKSFGAANPVLAGAAQLITDKNLYFDRPLSSEFLRKLPSLNSVAERLSGLPYDKLPLDLDAPAKLFLRAVPDNKGNLIADKNRFWILMNLVPGFMSRFVSTANLLNNPELPGQAKALATVFGVKVADTDLSRSLLSQTKENIDELNRSRSTKLRKEAIARGEMIY